MLFAVIIFGIMTYAFAQVSSENKECQYVGMTNFDSSKYFDIEHAYVTHAKNGRNSNFCRELTTTKHTNGTIATIAKGYDEISGETYYSEIYCSGPSTVNNQGGFTFDCHFLKDTRKRVLGNYKLFTSVIDTDYKTYAVLYRCTKIPEVPVNLENFLVLKTDKNSNNDEVKQSLQRKGMELDKFFSRNNEYCNSAKNKIAKEEGKKET
uniref:Putative triabin n=1 Tax=Panstrongylus lignarius TaxID=156445 RepID=A0A224XWR7_9HEMI